VIGKGYRIVQLVIRECPERHNGVLPILLERNAYPAGATYIFNDVSGRPPFDHGIERRSAA
jgi:hypothetical protein